MYRVFLFKLGQWQFLSMVPHTTKREAMRWAKYASERNRLHTQVRDLSGGIVQEYGERYHDEAIPIPPMHEEE